MTIALVVSQPVNMPGRNNTADLDEIRSLSSDYSFPQQAMISANTGLFSFSQTEPSADFQFPSWGTPVDGTQSQSDFPDTGSSHSGEHEEIIFSSGSSTPRGARLDQTQTVDNWSTSRIASVAAGGQAMSRMDSSRSSASSLSRSSQLSHMHSTGNASAFRQGLPNGSIAGMNSVLLDDTAAASSQMYWGDYPLDMNQMGLVDGVSYQVADINPLHVVSSGMPMGSDVNESSPLSWDCFSTISRTSSPSTVDDGFNILPLSPHSSPEILCQSPTVDRNPLGTEEYTILPGSQKEELRGVLPRRGSNESEARSDPLYKDAKPQSDGLYHCPFENHPTEECTHKPEKLKCNYDKFVDSHLKPYQCRVKSCNGAKFSSTACLLRHEREAHGWHGHGEKPYSCTYSGCDRAQPGNGFPRQWNLKDHMKRVHNDHRSADSSPPSSSAAQPVKSRKRKTEVPEAQVTTTRKTTVKAMPVLETERVSPKPLIEEWLDHRQAVEVIMRSGLSKPDDAGNIGQITMVQEHLAAMVKMTTDMGTTARMDVMPAPRARGYGSTG